MKLLVTVAAIAFASPQGCCLINERAHQNTRTRDNKLVSTPVKLEQLAPATGSVLVTTRDGLMRVPLDGKQGTVVDGLPGAMTTDGAIRIHQVGATYVVRTDTTKRVVANLVANDSGFLMAPDDRHVATAATTADGTQLAIISLADATARTFPITMDKFWEHRWADDGSAFFHHDRGEDVWRRVDLATGAITNEAPPIRSPDPDGSVDCAAKGFRLRIETRGERQRIMLEPIASKANPEILIDVEPRLLVEAEHLSYSRLRSEPAKLAHLKLLDACTHYLFDFGGWVYLGELASGRFAPLARGSDPR